MQAIENITETSASLARPQAKARRSRSCFDCKVEAVIIIGHRGLQAHSTEIGPTRAHLPIGAMSGVR